MNPDTLSTLAVAIPSVLATLGLSKLLELAVTRGSRRGQDAVLISADARAWAADATKRAQAAEQRADQLQTRLDELLVKLDAAQDAVDRLQLRIAGCQAGPVCPVRPLT